MPTARVLLPPAPPEVADHARAAVENEVRRPVAARRCRTPYAPWAVSYLVLIFGLPALAVGLALDGAASLGRWASGLACLLAPVLYAGLFVVVAGALSRPHQHAIRPGRFARDLCDPVYRGRRLYGLCWTAVYYFTPLYFLVLSLPGLKWLTFRLFGYRGQMDFTVYPDTWIRDLPLLDFGPGAYVSNKSTLGTNIAQQNGNLLVDQVKVGPRALVGHMAMLSTGTILEEGAEVGVGCAVGSKVLLRKGATISACCAVGHLVELGEGCDVGYMSSIGIAARIGAGVRLPPVTLVPNRARVDDQAAAAALFSSSLSPLPRLAEKLQPLRPSSPAPAPRPAADGSAHWNEFE